HKNLSQQKRPPQENVSTKTVPTRKKHPTQKHSTVSLHDNSFQDSHHQQPLTKQQRTILEAVLFFLRKGELPTVREVGALVGLRSPATVLKHLRALERENLISLSGKSRGIRIVDREHLEQVLEGGISSDAVSSDENPSITLFPKSPSFQKSFHQ